MFMHTCAFPTEVLQHPTLCLSWASRYCWGILQKSDHWQNTHFTASKSLGNSPPVVKPVFAMTAPAATTFPMCTASLPAASDTPFWVNWNQWAQSTRACLGVTNLYPWTWFYCLLWLLEFSSTNYSHSWPFLLPLFLSVLTCQFFSHFCANAWSTRQPSCLPLSLVVFSP